MSISISLFLILYFFHSTHPCPHDQIPNTLPTIVYQKYDMDLTKRSLSLTGSRFTQPIRILLNYDNLVSDPSSCYTNGQNISLRTGIGNDTISYICTSGDVLGENEVFLKQIMEKAREFWSSTLSVLPLNTLAIDTSVNAEESCGSIKIPDSYSSIDSVDLVVFVSARPLTSKTTLARATACQFDQLGPSTTGGRPIMSWINFGPAALAPDQTLELQEQIGITIHEMAHGLGFSYPKFQGLIQWNGVNWSPIPVTDVIVTTNSSGKQYICTPNVLEAVRDHFQCDTLIGAELESLGGSGTAGSHWSREQFMNEFMTGEASDFPVYSQITFALFKDMGWYDVYNNSLVQPLIWGWHLGCPFTTSCTHWPNTLQDTGYSCDQTSPLNQCTFDLRSVGICSIHDLLNDPLLENCYYYETYENLRCDNTQNGNNNNIGFDTGEVYEESSRCFVANILKISDQVEIPVGKDSFRCYATTCESDTQLKVSVDSIWYDCPYSGGEVQPQSYSGTIKCIPNAADRICNGQPLDPNWPKFYSLIPSTGTPGTVITIFGKNFNATPSLSVTLHAPCTITYINNTQLICTMDNVDGFSDLQTVFQSISGPTSLSLVIRDGDGRTYYGQDVFMLVFNPGVGLLRLIQQQPGWGVMIFGGIALLLLCLVLVCIKCCSVRKGKLEKNRPVEEAHHGLLTGV